MPVICVYSPHTSRVSRRYYCLYCWDYLSERASSEIPELMRSTGQQDAQHLGVLLGIESVVADDDWYRRPAERVELDTTLEFPGELLMSRVPFERWYPKGQELAEHKQRAKERMGRDVS